MDKLEWSLSDNEYDRALWSSGQAQMINDFVCVCMCVVAIEYGAFVELEQVRRPYESVHNQIYLLYAKQNNS